MSRKRKPPYRRIVQVFFFGLIALIAVNHSLVEAGKGLPLLAGASLHAVCPFGGVVSIYQVIATGTFVKKIHESSWVLMWIGFALALLVGPAFCGWVCPLGSLQEWFGRLGRKVFRRRFNRFIPYRYDRWLRYLRYGVLGWVLYATFMTGKLAFEAVDPYFALFNFWTSELAVSGLILLGVVVLASLFVERPFCKYACPYGAVLGLFNLIRVFKVRRNAATCISCGKCDKACPMNIPVSTSGAVLHHQCISCLECSSEAACPVKETVVLTPVRLDAEPVASERRTA